MCCDIRYGNMPWRAYCKIYQLQMYEKKRTIGYALADPAKNFTNYEADYSISVYHILICFSNECGAEDNDSNE